MKNTSGNYQIDSLDRSILNTLMNDARTAYSEIAKLCA